jgi:hypothetical protein
MPVQEFKAAPSNGPSNINQTEIRQLREELSEIKSLFKMFVIAIFLLQLMQMWKK